MRTGRARWSPSCPRPSTQASATRQCFSPGASRRWRVATSAGTASGARRVVSRRTGCRAYAVRSVLVASAAAALGVRGSFRRARAWAAETQRSGSRWLSRRTSASNARRSPAQPSRNAAISRAQSGRPGSTRTRASNSWSWVATSTSYTARACVAGSHVAGSCAADAYVVQSAGLAATSSRNRSTSERSSSSMTLSVSMDTQRVGWAGGVDVVQRTKTQGWRARYWPVNLI